MSAPGGTGVKKRFIAGATCPQCENEDTVYTLESGDVTSRHCTRCDFSEHLSELSDHDEPVTNVWQPIKLLDAN